MAWNFVSEFDVKFPLLVYLFREKLHQSVYSQVISQVSSMFRRYIPGVIAIVTAFTISLSDSPFIFFPPSALPNLHKITCPSGLPLQLLLWFSNPSEKHLFHCQTPHLQRYLAQGYLFQMYLFHFDHPLSVARFFCVHHVKQGLLYPTNYKKVFHLVHMLLENS